MTDGRDKIGSRFHTEAEMLEYFYVLAHQDFRVVLSYCLMFVHGSFVISSKSPFFPRGVPLRVNFHFPAVAPDALNLIFINE